MSEIDTVIEPEVVADATAPQEQAPSQQSEPAYQPRPIPHGALHAKHAELQELKRQLAELKAAQAPQPEMPPDAKADPVAFLHWQEKQARAEMERRQEEAKQKQTSSYAEEEDREAHGIYAECAEEFEDHVPDFREAYGYLYRLQWQALKNERVPFLQREEKIRQFELAFVKNAIRAGLNPAAAVYAKAQEYGWKPGAGLTPPPTEMQPAPMPPRDPATGQFAPAKQPARSLSQAPGAAPAGMPTPEQIAAMSRDEFQRFKDSGQYRKFFGLKAD